MQWVYIVPMEPCQYIATNYKCVNLVNVFISLMQVNIGNILKPIGMLYNGVLLQRQNTMIP